GPQKVLRLVADGVEISLNVQVELQRIRGERLFDLPFANKKYASFATSGGDIFEAWQRQDVFVGAGCDIGDRAVSHLLRVEVVEIRRHLVEEGEHWRDAP